MTHTPTLKPHNHIGGLDGLRGIALATVVVFHYWPDLLPGGFLGVSLFFALSGYLITGLLLNELSNTRTVDLRRFYTRRVRRLLPASLVTVAAVAVGWAVCGWMTDTNIGDITGALLNSSNWQRILSGGTYGAETDNAPVLHYWSLSIEEQFYLVLPLLLLAARTRRRAIAVITFLLVASVAYQLSVAGDASLVYYSTFSRAAELLAGALAAALVARYRGTEPKRAVRIGATGVAVAGLGTLGYLTVATSLGTGAYYQGLLVVCGIVGALTVAAAAHAPGLGRILDVAPLAYLGRMSYGIYLLHWPMIVAFDNAGVNATIRPWFALAATMAAAAVSNSLIETPFRLGAARGWRFGALIAAPVAVTVAVVMAVPGRTSYDYAAAAAELDTLIVAENAPASDMAAPAGETARPDAAATPRSANAPTTGPSTPPSTIETTVETAAETTAVAGPTRVGFFGDSKALVLALGIDAANSGDDYEIGTSYAALGCPVTRADSVREDAGSAATNIPGACDWTVEIPANVARTGTLDVAVVWSGSWDVRDLRGGAVGPDWTSVDTAGGARAVLAEMLAYHDLIVETTGAKNVVWLTVYTDPAFGAPQRIAAYNDLVRQLPKLRPGSVTVGELADWIAATGDADRLLPDGIHPMATDQKMGPAAEIGEQFLFPLIDKITR